MARKCHTGYQDPGKAVSKLSTKIQRSFTDENTVLT